MHTLSYPLILVLIRYKVGPKQGPPSTEEGDGVDLIADLLRANPEVGVLILSASLDTASIERAAEADEIMD
jgi:DNA-binding NarL/FixJ family response regulator